MTIVRDFAENIQSDGDLIVSGDLQVSGTTTTVNSTTVEIGDKNIVLGANATANSQNDGGGISILLPDPSPDEFATFTHTGTTWNLSDSLSIDSGNLTVNGEITSSTYNISSDSEHVLAFGTVSSISGATVDTTTLRGRQLDLYAYDDVFIRAGTSDSIRLWSGGDATLTLDGSNNATFEGTIAAPSGNVFVGKSDATLGTDGTNIASTSTIISASSGNTYHVYNTNTSTYPFVVSFDGNVTAGNLSADYSRLGRGFRTADRGELLIHSTAATDVSEIFFGFGDGHPGNDSNYRWTISDRGTNADLLVFYAAPATTGSNFAQFFVLDYPNSAVDVKANLRINGTTRIDSNGLFFPASLNSTGKISVLNGSAAQGIRVESLYAGTSYASDGSASGTVDTLNGYRVGGTTVIDSSRNVDAVGLTSSTLKLGQTAQSLEDFTAVADWAKPAGYSSMLRGTNQNASVVGTPVSANYWLYNVFAKRDGNGGTAGLLLNYDNGDFYTGFSSTSSTSPSWKKVVHESSNTSLNSLGVGTAASGTAGEIRATNNITAYYSDERLKSLEKPIDNALEKVQQLTGYYFTENEKAKELGYDNSRRQVGVSAQEVEKVLPEVVTSAPIDEEYKSVWYDKLVPLLIEAVKELKQEVEDLKRK